MDTKTKIDTAITSNREIMHNDGYFSGLVLEKTVSSFDEAHVPVSLDSAKVVQQHLTKEYSEEYNGVVV